MSINILPPQSRNEALLMGILGALEGSGGLQIHVCTSDEYDHETGVPTVASPASDTLYLVPASDATTGNLFDEWVYVAAAWEKVGSTSINVPVQDVQVNGVSVLQDGVANVPVAGSSVLGTVKINYGGLQIRADGTLATESASTSQIKTGTATYTPIVPLHQHESTFYGLAKAAGDTTQSASDNAVGAYTDAAKSAINTMLNGSVAVTGSTPSITALPGICYVCGEVTTIDITLPESGIVDVVFESGSTATVLTITPPTGQTMKWANGFDPTSLEANTTYEINVMDGIYGVVGQWT